MDRIFSARIADRTIRQIGDLSGKLHTSKKAVLEQAVELLEKKIGSEGKTDVFDQTLGAWHRQETPARTVSKAKEVFRKSMERHAR